MKYTHVSFRVNGPDTDTVLQNVTVNVHLSSVNIGPCFTVRAIGHCIFGHPISKTAAIPTLCGQSSYHTRWLKLYLQ